MKYQKILLCGAMMLGCFPAFGQEAVKDPLADARLSKQVQITAEGISVGDLLARLAKQTGLRLIATKETAEDKVILFGPARPLREILADIATLFGDIWREDRQNPEGEALLLARSGVAQRKEQERLLAPELQVRKQLQAEVQALAETPQQLARRPQNDSIRRLLSNPPSRRATQFYASLTAQQQETLLEKRRLRIPFAALNREQQMAMVQMVREERADKIRPFTPAVNIPEPQFSREAPAPDLEFTWQQNFTRSSVEPTRMQFFLNPANTCFAELDVRRENPPLHGNPYTGEKIAPNATLPDKEALIGKSDGDLPDVLRRLSEQTHLPVLADYYRSRPLTNQRVRINHIATNALEALDNFCLLHNSLWWTHGKTLLFRSQDWYLQKQYEVPDAWLQEMTTRMKNRGDAVQYADLVRLLQLTPRQQQGLLNLVYPQESLGSLPPVITRAKTEEEEKFTGVCRLLEMLQRHPSLRGNRNTNLPSALPVEQETSDEKAILNYTTLTGRQRELVPAFFATQPEERDAGPAETLKAWFWVTKPQIGDRGFHYRFVTTVWKLGTVQRLLSLPLPLSVPDDRREHTRIEWSEGNKAPSGE